MLIVGSLRKCLEEWEMGEGLQKQLIKTVIKQRCMQSERGFFSFEIIINKFEISLVSEDSYEDVDFQIH